MKRRQAAEHLASRKMAVWRGALVPDTGSGCGLSVLMGIPSPQWLGLWGNLSRVPCGCSPRSCLGHPCSLFGPGQAVCGTGVQGREPHLDVEVGGGGRDTDVKSKRCRSGSRRSQKPHPPKQNCRIRTCLVGRWAGVLAEGESSPVLTLRPCRVVQGQKGKALP